MKRVSATLLPAVLITLTAVASRPADAQTDSSAPPPGGTVAGRGTRSVIVDGARTPELIDEELLAAQIMATLMIPVAPNEMQERRFQLFVERIGLNGRDTVTLRREMNRLSELVTPVQAQLRATPAAREAMPLLEASRTLRLDAYYSLLAALSEGGRKRLTNFVEEQKRNTKVIGPTRGSPAK